MKKISAFEWSNYTIGLIDSVRSLIVERGAVTSIMDAICKVVGSEKNTL